MRFACLAPALILVAAKLIKYNSNSNWWIEILAWVAMVLVALYLMFQLIFSSGHRLLYMKFSAVLLICCAVLSGSAGGTVENLGFSIRILFDPNYQSRCGKITFQDAHGKTQIIGTCKTFWQPGSPLIYSVILDTSSELLKPYKDRSPEWMLAARQLTTGAPPTASDLAARHIVGDYYQVDFDLRLSTG